MLVNLCTVTIVTLGNISRTQAAGEDTMEIQAETENLPADSWGWNKTILAVPGFGFLPPRVNSELDHMTKQTLQQDVANLSNVTMSNLSVATIDHFKCTIFTDTWQMFYPHLAEENYQSMCPPLWDGASCVPPTKIGQTAEFPCMTMYNEKLYNTKYNATRECLPTGVWNLLTNYSSCKELCVEVDSLNHTKYSECDQDEDADLDISLYVYFVGYSISLVALLTALCIFLSFREMRCLRHKIHIGLFLTLILSDMSWIFTALIQNLIQTDHYESMIKIWCISQVILRYFHLTTFFWMFIEGLYLFLQVQIPLSLASIKHGHFLVIGWGLPLLNMAIWSVMRLVDNDFSIFPDSSQNEVETLRSAKIVNLVLSCPFMQEQETDFYAYKLPVFILLAANSFFLVWIMVIVVSKLKSQTALDHDRRHYKAAKALIIVIPLLGFTYLLTLMGPSKEDSLIAYTIFQSVRAVLLSTQGAVITLPYCYLNSEVQGVIKCHWERWKMVRNVEYECQSARTSVATSTIYYAQVGGSSSKLKMMTTKMDSGASGFLHVPTAPSRSCSRNSSRSVSFSDICHPFKQENANSEK